MFSKWKVKLGKTWSKIYLTSHSLRTGLTKLYSWNSQHPRKRPRLILLSTTFTPFIPCMLNIFKKTTLFVLRLLHSQANNVIMAINLPSLLALLSVWQVKALPVLGYPGGWGGRLWRQFQRWQFQTKLKIVRSKKVFFWRAGNFARTN